MSAGFMQHMPFIARLQCMLSGVYIYICVCVCIMYVCVYLSATVLATSVSLPLLLYQRLSASLNMST